MGGSDSLMLEILTALARLLGDLGVSPWGPLLLMLSSMTLMAASDLAANGFPCQFSSSSIPASKSTYTANFVYYRYSKLIRYKPWNIVYSRM